MFKYKVISSIAAIALMMNFVINLKFKSPEEAADQDANEQVALNDQPEHKIKPQSKRSPASVVKKQKIVALNQPEIKKAELDNSLFVNDSPPPLESESSSPVSAGAGYQSFVPYTTPGSIPSRQNFTNENIDPPKMAKRSNNDEQPFSGSIINTNPVGTKSTSTTGDSKPNTVASSIASSDTSSTTGSFSGPTVINSCSSNIAGGAFSNPIGINLSCTSISTIKYCLALDTGAGCCDPLASATTYSSKIIVGPKNGTYCLSYYGQSSSAGTTSVYQQSYIINSTLPNLQVAQPQINYQTTQLNGQTYVTSLDFGKTGYGIGQINLKAHDPGPSGLNYTCDDIMANYVSLSLPLPVTVLSLLDVSLDNPTMQIQIPLQVSQLDYGNNFITSYIENNNFAAPVYSCSTSNIVLNDFEFFQEELAFGDIGTNSVREFTGGLSPYGFFENAATVYRGPAGVDTNNNTGQELAYGMFGIFY